MTDPGARLVAAQGLSRRYGRTRALQDVAFTADRGQVIAVIGHNGAGKSTLVRILATVLRPDAGKYSIGGVDALAHPVNARALIGYLGHESMLDGALSMRENLRLFARLYGRPPARADELVERFGAQAYADRPVHEYSRGQEQTAGLCRALLHEPALLLLDEPSTGLDTAAQERLWQAAAEHARAGGTVVFTTHDHQAAKQHAHTVQELDQGQWTT
jgi:heme ABC exporter ATP-binding subunit CcmA